MSKVHEILSNLGYTLKDYGSHYRTMATYRGGTNPMSLAVHKGDGRFIDFGANSQRGSFKDLLALILGDKTVDIDNYADQVQLDSQSYVPKQKLKKKKVYDRSVLISLLPHWDMYLENGISKDTLRLFEVGLAQSGKLARRYCFPIYNETDEIIGFTGRWHQKIPFANVPKWKHIGTKTEWVWPLHLNKKIIEEKKEVIFVESPNCVLHLWENGIKNVLCLFGLNVGPKILKHILSLDLDRIVLATNNEPDNQSTGNNAAAAAKYKLLNYFDDSKILIHLPTKKDFGEMSSEEIAAWYKSLTELPNSVN